MSTDRKSFDQQTNSRNQFFTEMHGDQSGEFVFGYWGLNGHVQIDRFQMTSRPPYWCPKTILKTAAMLVNLFLFPFLETIEHNSKRPHPIWTKESPDSKKLRKAPGENRTQGPPSSSSL